MWPTSKPKFSPKQDCTASSFNSVQTSSTAFRHTSWITPLPVGGRVGESCISAIELCRIQSKSSNTSLHQLRHKMTGSLIEKQARSWASCPRIRQCYFTGNGLDCWTLPDPAQSHAAHRMLLQRHWLPSCAQTQHPHLHDIRHKYMFRFFRSGSFGMPHTALMQPARGLQQPQMQLLSLHNLSCSFKISKLSEAHQAHRDQKQDMSI